MTACIRKPASLIPYLAWAFSFHARLCSAEWARQRPKPGVKAEEGREQAQAQSLAVMPGQSRGRGERVNERSADRID
ncbi:hypothetical protein A4R35_09100 [Thermogemmatispora tikiterensis]|uniref:Secreted protein n=1 Tax=Thermogemmatispora tikiterensis TaxID=1825093 RepID=A0A328VFJ2_9CHLR|nr:hypothetical protein A4R35_09100 [Thermogemmatispora tikiterensis]